MEAFDGTADDANALLLIVPDAEVKASETDSRNLFLGIAEGSTGPIPGSPKPGIEPVLGFFDLLRVIDEPPGCQDIGAVSN